MFRELGRLLRSWWRADRVRVSPESLWLLRLQPGDVAILEGRTARITRRTVVEQPQGAILSLEGESNEDPFRLELRISTGHGEQNTP